MVGLAQQPLLVAIKHSRSDDRRLKAFEVYSYHRFNKPGYRILSRTILPTDTAAGVSSQCVMDFLVHASFPACVLERVPEGVENLAGILNSHLVTQISTKPF
jgi:hypothetical protein